ncbi:Protein kinase-like domain protein [Metarhizium album ARSEF 1941]|uniref:Protein kinase-like domain protein n=1 Tax=Metarhizium album (strain ARSEF 1941) TaxID=1081103 RepID=A0A0B2WXB6_METAS|nr:Protein kinase-like domain protein [Metarhizium album ARSEF 1941]KHN98683.1 Protein kinase-like domain protein [Metarhizium album ARSEF 1941]
MRITLIGTLLLFSALARCQRAAERSRPACVTDCQKSLAEHGLLRDGMKSTCATPKLQRAHFQCLINLCSPENYGRALAYSVSACCDTGVNIIPLHPIEVDLPPEHKRSQQPEVFDKTFPGDKFTDFNREFSLARNFAVALTCNAGQDGVVTVSLVSPQASIASTAMASDEEVFSVNGFMATVLSSAPAATSACKAFLVDGSRDLETHATTDCESSNSAQLKTSATSTTQTHNLLVSSMYVYCFKIRRQPSSPAGDFVGTELAPFNSWVHFVTPSD